MRPNLSPWPYRTVQYRTLPFRDIPFPRFGLKKPQHRSLKPYRFSFFKEKRLPNRSKKTPFSVSVFLKILNEKKQKPWSANFRCISGYFPSLKILKIKHILAVLRQIAHRAPFFRLKARSVPFLDFLQKARTVPNQKSSTFPFLPLIKWWTDLIWVRYTVRD